MGVRGVYRSKSNGGLLKLDYRDLKRLAILRTPKDITLRTDYV